MKKSKKEIKVMDVVLVFVGIAFVVFTAVMIVTFWRVGAVPDTLIGCFFAFIGGECGVMGWIKNVKEKTQDRKWQIEDEEKAKKQRKSNKI